MQCDVSTSRTNVILPCQPDVQRTADVEDRVSDGVVDEAIVQTWTSSSAQEINHLCRAACRSNAIRV